VPPEQIALHPIAQQISARLEIVDDELCLSEPSFQLSWEAITTAPASERETLGQHLLALAIKIQREGEGAGAIALAQLYLMVGQLLADFARAKVLFEAGGVDMSKAAEWLGKESSRLPVTTGSVAGGDSLFALRLNKDKS